MKNIQKTKVLLSKQDFEVLIDGVEKRVQRAQKKTVEEIFREEDFAVDSDRDIIRKYGYDFWFFAGRLKNKLCSEIQKKEAKEWIEKNVIIVDETGMEMQEEDGEYGIGVSE